MHSRNSQRTWQPEREFGATCGLTGKVIHSPKATHKLHWGRFFCRSNEWVKSNANNQSVNRASGGSSLMPHYLKDQRILIHAFAGICLRCDQEAVLRFVRIWHGGLPAGNQQLLRWSSALAPFKLQRQWLTTIYKPMLQGTKNIQIWTDTSSFQSKEVLTSITHKLVLSLL